MRRLLGALVVCGVLAAACSGGAAFPATGGTEVSGAGITATAPEGWTSHVVDGTRLVIALDPDDLTAELPRGPRMIAGVAASAILDVDAEIDTEASIVGDPQRFVVDGRPAVAIDATDPVAGVTVVSRVFIVKLADGSAYRLTLEAPAAAWASDRSTLEAIVASVRFV